MEKTKLNQLVSIKKLIEIANEHNYNSIDGHNYDANKLILDALDSLTELVKDILT